MGIAKNKYFLYKNGLRADCPAVASAEKAMKIIAKIESFGRQLGHEIRPLECDQLSADFGIVESTPQGDIEYKMICKAVIS